MNREYRVRIKLLPVLFWDTTPQFIEVLAIKDWVTEQCNWNEDKFEIKIHSRNIMDVWFEHEKDAVICALRWL